MPAIDTNVEDPNCVTTLDPIQLIAIQCEGARNSTWEIFPPNGSASVVANPTAFNTTFTPDINGAYGVKLCCYFETDTQVGDYDPNAGPPQLSCPLGIIAGTNADIDLFNCVGGSVLWTTSAGSIAGNENGATLTTPNTAPATINVGAICTDADGAVSNLTCEIATYPADLLMECSQSEIGSIRVDPCGVFCSCIEGVFFVKTDELDCQRTRLCISIKDCTTIPEPDPC